MSKGKENPATVLVGKIDRVLSEVSMFPPSEFKSNMMKHINSMCILVLLEYGSKTQKLPKLEFILTESSKQ